ncbi:MFS transporter [Mycolicibacterium sp. CBMA 226]|uniref:MFS transporter n=1 Tax=Mycolicibacterium sp. CBMA 226 TaxID=2606611 RepID=UPI0012DEAFB6|nr:MFS transporter [Mycolicibacterium sp. CBMA 226]MUL78498.1 MFS transporter [Mycolicibacterium sp. CBMA 226]
MDSSTLPKNSPTAPTRRFHPGLSALALGGFGIGLTEFVIAGLLTDVADALHVSVPAAGALIWGYALAVVVGAFTVTAILSRRPPKTALLVLLALFVAGNGLTALAPSFGIAMLGRIITALCHGGFFGIGAVVAGDLVTPERKASAIAVMFGGLTLSNVLGVPFGTFVGQHLGWRSAFWIISALGVLAIACVAVLVPRLPTPSPAGSSHFSVLYRRQVMVSIVLTMMMFGGVFGAFIYVQPLVTRVTGYRDGSVPWLLVLFGIGLFIGNFVGGWAADRDLTRTLRVLSLLLPVVLIAYGTLASYRIPVAFLLVVMGLVGFAATPALQLRVMRFADDSPTMASAANIAAFNLGNAIASGIGAATIALGLGWRSPVWVGAAMALVGTVLVFTNSHGEAQ